MNKRSGSRLPAENSDAVLVCDQTSNILAHVGPSSIRDAKTIAVPRSKRSCGYSTKIKTPDKPLYITDIAKAEKVPKPVSRKKAARMAKAAAKRANGKA